MGADTPAPASAIIVGAGALGTVYGAALARAGAAVQLLSRRAHAEAIESAGGVRVTSPDGDWFAPLRASWDPAALTPAELVVVLCKSHDTESALAGLEHIRDAVEVAVSFQNGVEKDRILASWCGDDGVLGGMSMVGATLERPGTVAHTLRGTSYVGELTGGRSARAEAVGALLEAGGMASVVTDRIVSAEWSKLVHAAPTMTLTALTRLPFHRVLLDPGLARLHVALVREGAAVAQRAGVELDDWPGMFPVRSMSTLAEAEAVELLHERGRAMAAAGSTNVRVSMLSDVERGRPLEIRAVHGFLAAEAERLGVDAPLTRASAALLSGLDTARPAFRRSKHRQQDGLS